MPKSYKIKLLKKYFKEFYKLKTAIKLIDKYDYYIIYFLDKDFFDKNLNKIENLFNKLDKKYRKELSIISKSIEYGYFYNFYKDDNDFNNDVKNGLCKDLTLKFINNQYSNLKLKSIYNLNLEYDLAYKNFNKSTIFNNEFKNNIKQEKDIKYKCWAEIKIISEYITNYGEHNGYSSAA